MSDLKRAVFLLVINTEKNILIASLQPSQAGSAEDQVVWACCAGARNQYAEFSEPFNCKWCIHFHLCNKGLSSHSFFDYFFFVLLWVSLALLSSPWYIFLHRELILSSGGGAVSCPVYPLTVPGDPRQDAVLIWWWCLNFFNVKKLYLLFFCFEHNGMLLLFKQ